MSFKRPRIGSRAFTLIELLVIIALIGTMSTVAVLSVGASTRAFRLKGATRDIFAAIRLARSTALLSGQPCIITYATKRGEDGSLSARVEMTGAKLMGDSASVVETIAGDTLNIGEDPEPAELIREADDPLAEGEESGASEKGHTVEEQLFQPISESVVEGVRILVEGENEDLGFFDEKAEKTRRARVSIYSNVDFLLRQYQESREREETAVREETQTESEPLAEAEAQSDTDEIPGQAPRSFIWQVNGRCEPHRVSVFLDGSTPESGLVITVNRFGTAQIVNPEDL